MAYLASVLEAIGRAILAVIGRYHAIDLNHKEPPSSVSFNNVLFFPDTEYPCPEIIKAIVKGTSVDGACPRQSCRKLHGRINEPRSSLIQFLKLLSGAQEHVELCIYIFTQGILGDIIRELHSRCVRVRIITDATDDNAHTTQVNRLRNLGIEVRTNKRYTGRLMHHKFVIIDGEMLLSGSFNWTNKAVVSNYEVVMVTKDASLVRPFTHEFENLWKMFEGQ